MMASPNAAPALVVIGSSTATARRPDLEHAHIARDKLMASLPAARRVLAWGRAPLRTAYLAQHPGSVWQQAESLAALEDTTQGPFDLIVLTDGLEEAADPSALLRALRRHAHAQTLLALAALHEPSLDRLRRWVEADLTTDDAASGGLHRWSRASTTKLLMDAGWMPSVADAVIEAPRDEPFTQAALQLAAVAGVPATTACQQWGLRQAIVHAHATFDPCDAPAHRAVACNFAVVVPTTRETQLRLNVEASPGLREVDARVISVRRAASPADALARAREHVHEDWILLCHQDVYFAPSFGHRLAALLDTVPAEERARTLIGFAGIGVNRASEAYEQAGFVIDRSQCFDRPASDTAVSIDELALVLPRESVLQIDPALGWHLWATDLCLQAICTQRFFPRIVRVPLFHNSLSDHQLPAAFHESARVLAAKHPGFGSIHTLCGVIGAGAAGGRR